jgi:hypothetical protein
MPTGYTAKLYDGEQSFEDFVLACARAFGALVTLRDENIDTPLPERLKPSTYHIDAWHKAEKELADLKTLTLGQAEAKSLEEFKAHMTEHKKSVETRTARNARYNEMLERVREWAPPTTDHENLKKFMVEQITISLEDYDIPVPTLLNGGAWLEEQKRRLEWSLAYHDKEWKKDVERTEQANKWIDDLRDSLIGVVK